MTTNRQYTEQELGYPTQAEGRIPAFANRDEEAAFWDTHDISKFVGHELQPIDVSIGGELAGRLTLRLDQADRQELQRRANVMGIGPSTLARIWLTERLRQESEAEAQNG
ncbi:MAG: CopG family antitoxin [Thermomicrobiales bacterium]